MPKDINRQKAPKDELLNSILHEIDEENGIEIKPEIDKPVKKTKQKKEQHPLLRALFFFLSTLIVLFLMFMIVMITLTEEKSQEKKKLQNVSTPIEQEPKKMMPKKAYDFKDFSKPSLREEGNIIVGTMQKKVVQEEPIEENVEQKEVQVTREDFKSENLQERKRKTAKERLLEQMKN